MSSFDFSELPFITLLCYILELESRNILSNVCLKCLQNFSKLVIMEMLSTYIQINNNTLKKLFEKYEQCSHSLKKLPTVTIIRINFT